MLDGSDLYRGRLTADPLRLLIPPMELMPWGNYERLRPAQIEAIRAEYPIAYLPWGALEWHSYHAPIGLDGMKAHGLCTAMARQTGGVVLPPVYIATDTIKPLKGFKHTLEHAEDTIKTLCREFLEQLADEGFKVLIIMTGHYGGVHQDAAGRYRQRICGRAPRPKGLGLPDKEPMEGHFNGDHAAIGETSFQLLFDADLVDLSLVPQDRAPTLDDDGVWGDDPKNATRRARTPHAQGLPRPHRTPHLIELAASCIMKTRPLGRSGLQVSPIGLGTWAFNSWIYGETDNEESIRTIRAALDLGMTFFDTAPLYGVGKEDGVAERILGQGLGADRDRVIISTKFGRNPSMEGTHFNGKTGPGVG